MKQRNAFTLLELIVIVVLIAILVAVAAMRYEKPDELREAAQQILRHIRYTQHLAMQENKFDPQDARYLANPGQDGTKKGMFFRERWHIRFYSNSGTYYYAITSDRDREGNIDVTTHIEPAINSQTKLILYRASSDDAQYDPKMNLTLSYSIASLASTCNRSPTITELFFDHYGRPYTDVSASTTEPYMNLLTTDCNLTLTHSSGRRAIITIKPETGYSFISYID
ncbi:MAG: type II secretion system GspH family protein [Campylobacterales bacterium]